MDTNSNTITQDIEQLIKKASEANTVIIAETAKFLTRLAEKKVDTKSVASIQKQLFADALNLFVKLNLQHTSNLIDMGVALSRHLNVSDDTLKNGQPGVQTKSETNYQNTAPAFELATSVAAGEIAKTAFLLNSDKKETLHCSLAHSIFLNTQTAAGLPDLKPIFTPDTFQLAFGEPFRIDVSIPVAKDIAPGIYRSSVSVVGFEHTHFDLLLEIMEAKLPETKKP